MEKNEIRSQVEENYRLDCGIKYSYKFTSDEKYLMNKIVESNFQQRKVDETLNKFQELTKTRDVYFLQDDDDGYFIRYCEKGQNLRLFKVPELIYTKHTDILSAMEFAVEYFKKKDDDFKELINRISGQ